MLTKLLVLVLAVLTLATSEAQAARYWCTDLALQSGEPDATFEVHLTCAYVGTDVQGNTQQRRVTTQIVYAPTPDSAAEIRTKVTDAVVAMAAQIINSSGGSGVTVSRAGGFIPAFQTGQ